MKKYKKLIIGSIGTIAIGVIIELIGDYIKGISIMKFLWEIIKRIGEIAYSILTFKVSLWIYFLISLVIIVMGYLYLSIKYRKQENLEPDYKKYDRDKFKHVMVRWTYNGNIPANFVPICNQCGCPLDTTSQIGNRHFGTEQYICPNCNKHNGEVLDYNYKQTLNKIIFHNIESGKYKEKISITKEEQRE